MSVDEFASRPVVMPASISQAILPRAHDLGGFEVRRALPARERQMVGPFIFFDQMGPGEFLTGKGLDVRPHPHIGLSTITYLFDGEIQHRDSLGSNQDIRPGDVNWMSAGRGIVHSERTPSALRASGGALFGVQSWIALPKNREEGDPSFEHLAADALPIVEDAGSWARLIAGDAWGVRAPVGGDAMFYADVRLQPGSKIPLPSGHEERAIYTLDGVVEVGGDKFGPGQMLILRAGDELAVTAVGAHSARLLLLGGATMNGPRHIFWNFVSSSRERIEQAKADWEAGRFGLVPGDEKEFIPLPRDRMKAASGPPSDAPL